MKGEGAIVFIIAFAIFLTATLAYTELPPRQYDQRCYGHRSNHRVEWISSENVAVSNL